MTIPDVYQQFLPHGPSEHAAQAKREPPKKAGRPDPEATPERQMVRRLGFYAANIIRDQIKVDYANQLEKWNSQISGVTLAFSKALGQQAQTLKDAEAEMRAEAELQAFLFSLMLSGVMSWAAAFVQFKIAPRFVGSSWEKRNAQRIMKLGKTQALVINQQVVNEQLADFVGNLTKDFGMATVDYLGDLAKAPSPYSGLAPGDHSSLVLATEKQLKDALSAGTNVVRRDIEKAAVWVNQEATFGEAWVNWTGGNETEARNQIRTRLQDVRDTWAARWPYFGQDPIPILEDGLQRRLERLLWAAYLDEYFAKGIGKGALTYENMTRRRTDAWVKAQYGRNQSQSPREAERETDNLYLGFILDFPNAIVSKLKKLNVVIAETTKGKTDQKTEAAKYNLPDPYVPVSDDVDTFGELYYLWGWAKEAPSKEAGVLDFGGGGTPRKLLPLH
jgi:hypothetical protein